MLPAACTAGALCSQLGLLSTTGQMCHFSALLNALGCGVPEKAAVLAADRPVWAQAPEPAPGTAAVPASLQAQLVATKEERLDSKLPSQVQPLLLCRQHLTEVPNQQLLPGMQALWQDGLRLACISAVAAAPGRITSRTLTLRRAW